MGNACTVYQHMRKPVDHNPGPPLGAQVLLQELRTLAEKQNLEGAHVGYKRNAKGEHVVALIFTGWRRL